MSLENVCSADRIFLVKSIWNEFSPDNDDEIRWL